ncbi:MAG: hypothetical protein CMI52_04810 [Parcubacteria group bacterium]|nr:hypothetical protein [Parcubacteria group bacterium]|tara:strand:- start:212 stop:415 length:204 start_codon:yes stop_codon:yes gene_type:complete
MSGKLDVTIKKDGSLDIHVDMSNDDDCAKVAARIRAGMKLFGIKMEGEVETEEGQAQAIPRRKKLKV